MARATTIKNKGLPFPNIRVELGDNAIAMSIVIFSGALSLSALLQGVDDDRAKIALAAGSSGLSGVIGYIGGKSSRGRKEYEDGDLVNSETNTNKG